MALSCAAASGPTIRTCRCSSSPRLIAWKTRYWALRPGPTTT
nr:hypothetical protein [Tanacetum cinerariifolium]